jgi:hypothetical protein
MKQKSPHRDVNPAQRVTLALQLRAQKMTYDQIAHQCGYADRSACYRAVQRELERTVVENVEALRREELAMLDTLHAECWARMQDSEYETGMLFAVDRLLVISERRCKLMGLDKPVTADAIGNVVVVRELPSQYLGAKSE